MSRFAKIPVIIPNNVIVEVNNDIIIISYNNNKIKNKINKFVFISHDGNKLLFSPKKKYKNIKKVWSFVGTMRSLVNNMIIGVTQGFIKRLQLVGIGYKFILKKNKINLFLGFSHSIEYKLPLGIFAECISQNELIIKGIDKQLVGRVAAELRLYRIPEPYKGKGIRYLGESVHIKEIKKK